MNISPRRRLGYAAVLGLGCSAVYTLIFPIPYTSSIDYPALTALFAFGTAGGWKWLTSHTMSREAIDLTDTATSHEFTHSVATRVDV